MKMSDNTILITGGTSGIGLELAARLLTLGNTVIITGRSQSHLDAARRNLPGIYAMQSDVSDLTAIAGLYRQVVEEFPGLNVLINNAEIIREINLHTFGSYLQDLTRKSKSISMALSVTRSPPSLRCPSKASARFRGVLAADAGICLVPNMPKCESLHTWPVDMVFSIRY
jgi:NAD(P)-dependent dehydrogenase (short-subunit alcohol dehydrogenase family)